MDYLCGCAYRSDGGVRGGGTIHKPELLDILFKNPTATKTAAKKHDDTTESLLRGHAVTL